MRVNRRTERQIDVMKLIVAFRNSANAPNNRMNHLIENLNDVRDSTALLSTHFNKNVLRSGFSLTFLEPNKGVYGILIVSRVRYS
jgi:hypothetical protein